MTTRGPLSERPILIGYVALESWAEDYSDWDGHITGPVNPKGANLAWQNPIEMIEKRAYDAALARAEYAEKDRDNIGATLARTPNYLLELEVMTQRAERAETMATEMRKACSADGYPAVAAAALNERDQLRTQLLSAEAQNAALSARIKELEAGLGRSEG